jgi:hypothetical protein
MKKTPFGVQKIPNPSYGNATNSGLTAFERLEKEQKRKNDEMIANLKPDSSGFGNHGGKKSRKSKRSRRSNRSRRSRTRRSRR